MTKFTGKKNLHFGNHFSSLTGLDISAGLQNASDPLLERWAILYQGLRICNTFLENVHLVPDLPAWEREQWIAEAKVLKAYYHFTLVQMYGPIPLVRKSLSVDADVFAVKATRASVDEVFAYIVELLDEANNEGALPLIISDPASDYGRITKPIALALKAKVLVYAASPLFNGNNDQASLKNHDGTPLFDVTFRPEKWERAMVACKEAIDVCHEAGLMLYKFDNVANQYNDTTVLNITLRNAFNLRLNREIIWANTQMISVATGGGMIFATMPKLNRDYINSGSLSKFLCVPIKIAEMFYTENGVPLNEDKTRDMGDIYNLRTSGPKDRLYIRQGRTSIDMHFNREPRFYAWVGFDGGVWFGAGQYNDKDATSLRYLGFKVGETDGTDGQANWTGYIPKKIVPYEAQVNSINNVSSPSYAWPIMRLSELYLLYAESINEAQGPNGASSVELFTYIDQVRKRAGLKGVKESWDTYTNNPKYNTKAGMREIIQKERLIELSFEGHRFWDIRRWKTAPREYRTPLRGWNMTVSTIDGTEEEVNRMMYQPQLLLAQKFGVRDYFWPIKTQDIAVNPLLVQNIGW